MWVWIVVSVVVVALVLAVWIGNAYRLAKKNKSLVRRSTGLSGPSGGETRGDPRTGEVEQGL
ncbi:hypothetical protein DQ238_02580 [Geodermatophilus sp. TF02-6]|uniref:hypothetical protein n=1 Tax=Geodermatophilus sp. TF02-6 TaxID=2250575 RepID=UPI000DEBE765|nr:hypothetical protein [Geodermatophilus sp. TF02-6]RBY82911.1 hypothetical protein DQ238_02580 [Geodermatophilus sp. TF02-6]